jgi:hypothetical protein
MFTVVGIISGEKVSADRKSGQSDGKRGVFHIDTD